MYLNFHSLSSQGSTPNLKLSPDEESDIAGLLTSTHQPIPDLDQFVDVHKDPSRPEENSAARESIADKIGEEMLIIRFS